MRATRLFLGAAAALAVSAGTAAAQSAGQPCLSSITGGNVTVPYNPFAGGSTGVSQTVTLTFERPATGVGSSGGNVGSKTQFADIVFLREPTDPDGVSVTLTDNTNILFPSTSPPSPFTVNGNNNRLEISFGGASQPNTTTAQVNVGVLPGTLLTTQNNTIVLDAFVVCKLTGGSDLDPQVFQNALTITFNVVPALQVRWQGTLGFGEIGEVTNPVDAPPVAGNFVIRSTSQYDVTFDSANDYRLRRGSDTSSQIGYHLDFLGATKNPGDTAPVTLRCPTAGVQNERFLPLQARLAEGGFGKQPGAYSDTLTVTFAPKGLTSTTTGTCPTGL